MPTINADGFREICDQVWRDRAAVLTGCGNVTGDVALLRSVFWRLCKVGIRTNGPAQSSGLDATLLTYQMVIGHMLKKNARPSFDGAPILKDLTDRYQSEVERG